VRWLPGQDTYIPPLTPGCPWSDWTRPTTKWCESHLCSIIVAPANTWSNLAFIFFGAQMIKRSHNLNSRTLSMFGPASIMTGVTSLLYHASYTWFFQVFDFVGMFCFLFVIISLNSRRLGWILPQYVHKFAVSGILVFSAAVPLFSMIGLPIQLLVLLLILAALTQEFIIYRRVQKLERAKIMPNYKALRQCIGLLVAGLACSLLDATRIWCNPSDHIIQGHAAWHLLSASGLYSAFFFYEQFAFDEGMQGLPVTTF